MFPGYVPEEEVLRNSLSGTAKKTAGASKGK
jgi:hypothetical protein